MSRKKYILATMVITLMFSAGVSAKSFSQEQDSSPINAIIALFQFVDDDNIHLKELVNSYFYGDDIAIDILTADVLGVVGKINPRRFTLSKHTIYNKLLARMLDLLIENGSVGGDVQKMADMCEKLLFENRDPIIYPKVVQLYNIVQEDSYRFSKYVLTTLQKAVFSTEYQTNTDSMVASTIPYVTQRINKEVVSDSLVMTMSMNIYTGAKTPIVYQVMKELITAIIRTTVG